MRLVFLFIVFLLVCPDKSRASPFWYECEVYATVQSVNYFKLSAHVRIEEFKVLDGFGGAPTQCHHLENKSSAKIQIRKKLKVGEQIKLKYHYYDALTPDGVVVSETWSYLPESQESIFYTLVASLGIFLVVAFLFAAKFLRRKILK